VTRNGNLELGSAQPSTRIIKAPISLKEPLYNKPMQRNYSRGRLERDTRSIDHSI
jgi:hypothetical protein